MPSLSKYKKPKYNILLVSSQVEEIAYLESAHRSLEAPSGSMLQKIASNQNLAFSRSAPRVPSSSMLWEIADNQNLAFSWSAHRSPGAPSSSMLWKIASNQNLAFSQLAHRSLRVSSSSILWNTGALCLWYICWKYMIICTWDSRYMVIMIEIIIFSQNGILRR